MPCRILMIDNYDSFTFNLVQLFRSLGGESAEVHIFRNDRITVEQARGLNPTHLIISPGPGGPRDAGISMELITSLAPTTATLGVCLGHQAIAEAFGGRVIRAPHLMHGKSSMINHDARGVFAGLDSPMEAGRYHSLIVEQSSLPPDLLISATTVDGAIMGLRHRRFPCEGVQFHPESILTPLGERLIANFLKFQPAAHTPKVAP